MHAIHDSVSETNLNGRWYIQSSARISADGAEVSSRDYGNDGWVPATVPGTVLGNLVNAGTYPDIFMGKNLENVNREDFSVPWCYRTEFFLDEAGATRFFSLALDGVNFRADVWINGIRIASADRLYGAFNRFSLDVTGAVLPGKNAFAILVHPPKPGDYTIGYADWVPRVPDENMGVFREVRIRSTGAAAIDRPFVRTALVDDAHSRAEISVSAEVANLSGETICASVKVFFDGATLERNIMLEPFGKKEVRFEPRDFPRLRVSDPRLWWPAGYGESALYEASLEVSVDGVPSDWRNVRFGIREVGEYKTEGGHRGYTINGKKILIRGAGWTDRLFLDEDPENLEAQMRYVRHMNLNTVRLEGFWGSSERLYKLADEYGILLMAGWSCHWEWKHYLGKDIDERYGGAVSKDDMDLIAGYLDSQVCWLRNHPSLFLWVLGSDRIPHPELERRYVEMLSRIDPTRPYLASCADKVSEVSGPSGVKMRGPYDYVPPRYWYEDTEHGGAFGFNTETGPGPQIPPLESLRKMLSPDSLWPIDSTWDYHCARGMFGTIGVFKTAFDRRYGESKSLDDFAYRSQAASYEAMRAMFEAFEAGKPETTGIVQWMLNSAWPKMVWQLYDYYLVPTGAFYGAKKAGERTSLVYDYADRGVYFVNNGGAETKRGVALVRMFDGESNLLFEKKVPVSVSGYSSARVLELPPAATLNGKNSVSFADLMLTGEDGSVSRNFYWLSSKEDAMSYGETQWYCTPIRDFADFVALASLRSARIDSEAEYGTEGTDTVMAVTLKNRSDAIAFFIELSAIDAKTKELAVPVYWDDNYVSLLPREERRLTARIPSAALDGRRIELALKGWNLKD